jgi:adenylate kinase family enzyme
MMNGTVGKRIIVVGSSNAGKSTLGERVAELLNAPFIELDGLHWEPGWIEAKDDVFRARVRQAIAPESWVIAGNYLRQQQDVSWPEAETIVWLDLSMPTVLGRCIRRTWRRWRTQEVLYGGENREIFWEHLMLWNPEKSLIAHILKTHRARRRLLEADARDHRWAHLRFIRLRSEAEVNLWLSDLLRPGTLADDSPDQEPVTAEPA